MIDVVVDEVGAMRAYPVVVGIAIRLFCGVAEKPVPVIVRLLPAMAGLGETETIDGP